MTVAATPPKRSREPFDPLRKGLYTREELMEGYSPTDPDGSRDRRITRHFLASGGRDPDSAAEAIAQRLHDFGIDEALRELLARSDGAAPKVVGMMGSHRTRRDDPRYQLVAETGWRIARAGYLLVTGGGPGMMEAANLGAYLARYGDRSVIERATAILRTAPAWSGRYLAYIEAARRVLTTFPDGAENLGIPTWTYPSEPINLFSSRIAKYFSNSVREDGLMAVSTHGVVFTTDTPGTVREIFQAAEQNCYWVGERRSAMVLLGPMRDGGALCYELLRSYAERDGYAALVAAFDDPAGITDFIERTPPLARPAKIERLELRRARAPLA